MPHPLHKTRFLVSAADANQLGPCRAEVALVGRSNVGKSSLLNALVSQTGLARVSRTPGRTRLINVFLAGPDRWIVDLPGYGYAAGPTRLDWQMVVWLRHVRLPHRIVATKTDRVKPSRQVAQRRDVAAALHLHPDDLSWVSSTKGKGLTALRNDVAARLELR